LLDIFIYFFWVYLDGFDEYMNVMDEDEGGEVGRR